MKSVRFGNYDVRTASALYDDNGVEFAEGDFVCIVLPSGWDTELEKYTNKLIVGKIKSILNDTDDTISIERPIHITSDGSYISTKGEKYILIKDIESMCHVAPEVIKALEVLPKI